MTDIQQYAFYQTVAFYTKQDCTVVASTMTSWSLTRDMMWATNDNKRLAYFRISRCHVGFFERDVPPISIIFCSPSIQEKSRKRIARSLVFPELCWRKWSWVYFTPLPMSNTRVNSISFPYRPITLPMIYRNISVIMFCVLFVFSMLLCSTVLH